MSVVKHEYSDGIKKPSNLKETDPVINKRPENDTSKENITISRKLLMKIGAGVFAAALMFGAGAFIHEQVSAEQNTDTEQDSGTEQDIPKEAQSFVEQYGDRYADPVATYYAVEAYQKANGDDYDQSVVLSDEYVANFANSHGNYDTSGINYVAGGESELGFHDYELPDSEAFDQDTNLKIFNDYFIPMVNRYMNLLAKNPSPDAVALIDAQFLECCSNTGDNFSYDDQQIEDLMTMAKDIVATGGSEVNYSILPATIDKSDGNVGDGTTFFDGLVDEGSFYYSNTNENLDGMTGAIKELDIRFSGYSYDYDKNKVYSTEDTKVMTNDCRFTVQKQPTTIAEASFNYVSIGISDGVPDISKLKDKQ